MGFAHMSIAPINARLNDKPLSNEEIGPFKCRHYPSGISVKIYLRRIEKDASAQFWVLRPERDLSWARGVVESAMRALWGREPSRMFKENGWVWEITRVRVAARHADSKS